MILRKDFTRKFSLSGEEFTEILLRMHVENYIEDHLLSSDFNRNWNMSTGFIKNPKYIIYEIHPINNCWSMRTERQARRCFTNCTNFRNTYRTLSLFQGCESHTSSCLLWCLLHAYKFFYRNVRRREGSIFIL